MKGTFKLFTVRCIVLPCLPTGRCLCVFLYVCRSMYVTSRLYASRVCQLVFQSRCLILNYVKSKPVVDVISSTSFKYIFYLQEESVAWPINAGTTRLLKNRVERD